MKQIFLSLVWWTLFQGFGLAQSTVHQQKIDSLLAVIKTTSADTFRVNLLLQVSKESETSKQFDESRTYAFEGKALAEQLGYKRGLARTLDQIGHTYYTQSDYAKSEGYYKQSAELYKTIHNKAGQAQAQNMLGNVNYNLGNYLLAIDNFKESLQLHQEMDDLIGVAGILGNIGVIYMGQNDFVHAIDYVMRSLKIKEDIGDRRGIAYSYIHLANIYKAQREFDKAIEYNEKSLAITEDIGDKYASRMALLNLGSLYNENQANPDKALEYYNRSLAVSEELGSKEGISSALASIGQLHEDKKEFALALDYYHQSLAIRREIGFKAGVVSSLNNIGDLYIDQGDYAQAIAYLNEGLTLANELGSPWHVRAIAKSLWMAYKANGQFQPALEAYELFVTMKDSILSEESQKEVLARELKYQYEKRELVIQKELELSALTFEFEKKQALAKSEEEKKKLQFDEELKRKQIGYEFEQKQIANEVEHQRKEAASKAEQDKKNAVAQKELQRQKLVRNGFVGGFTIMLLFAGVFFTQRNKIQKGKKRSDELLLNILPEEVAEELKLKGSAEAKHFDDVTVMFTDFKNFTRITEKLSPAELVEEIHTCFEAFDHIIGKHNIEKIKTIGDSYMCVGGLPLPNSTNATDVVNAALEIQDFMRQHLAQRIQEHKEPFEIRIGVHTGPVVAGIVGVKKFAYDIWGDTVNIASRMESSGEAGKINVSGSTYALVKNKFSCIHRGKIQAKNKGEFDMYFVEAVM